MLDPRHPVKIAAADWARSNLAERSDRFDREAWERAAAEGILGLRVATRYGGSDRSTVDALLTFEGLGFGSPDNGLVFALASQVFAMQTAFEGSGSEEQKSTWLPRLVSGRAIGAFAMTERDSGSDAASISTRATALPDGRFRLDGEKAWVTLGPVADLVIVFAVTDPERGRWGITAFAVPTDTPGLDRGRVEPKSGLESCPFGFMRFDECIVGPDTVLGNVGAGMAIFTSAVEAERAFLYACQVGAMERVIDRAIDRARSRRQGGRPIGQYQGVSHRLADMKLRHESARLLIYKAGILHDQGESVTMAAALAKLASSESMVATSIDALTLHGAEGYTVAAGLEAEVRDALGGLAYSGTSDIQKNIVARLLGADRPPRGTHGTPT